MGVCWTLSLCIQDAVTSRDFTYKKFLRLSFFLSCHFYLDAEVCIFDHLLSLNRPNDT